MPLTHLHQHTGPLLKIAVPNKGRLSDPALSLLRRVGFEFEEHERKLSATVFNFPAELLFVNAKNVPEYAETGVVDIGITGLDIVREQRASVRVLESLGFGHTDLVVAVPTHSSVRRLQDLANKKIATVFPELTRAFFARKRIRVRVQTVSGAVEITPWIGLADAIADLTSSGSTLRMNELRPLATILESEAVLISSKADRKEVRSLKRTFILRIESVLRAERRRYIMMNAPRRILPAIKKVAPGLSAPTVMDLAEPGMIAVHSVIDEKNVWEIVEKLQQLGATGILVIPIEKMTR